MVKMVEDSAKGAAIATGCEVKLTVRPGLKSNIRNPPLREALLQGVQGTGGRGDGPRCASAAGWEHRLQRPDPLRAWDACIRSASRRLTITGHSRELCAATLTEEGHKGIEIGAKVLALAGVEILTDEKLRAEIKDAFDKAKK